MSRGLITKVLESAGHRVWTATNGKEAALNVQSEAFDLILLDLQMPDIDSLEATRAIRAAEAPGLHVPIYALTAHPLPDDRDNCFAAGMDAFIAKPIVADELLQLVSKLAPRTAHATVGNIALDHADKAPVAETNEEANEFVLPTEYVIPEYVESETAAASEVAARGTDDGDFSADSGEDEFALEADLSNPGDLALDATGSSYVSEGDATSSSDFLHDGELLIWTRVLICSR